MGTMIIDPRQAKGIYKAVANLSLSALLDDQMVGPGEQIHLTELDNGSGDIQVEFTEYGKKRYVYSDGTLEYEPST